MVKLESFNASLYRNFIYCESNYDSLVTWLCGSLFIYHESSYGSLVTWLCGSLFILFY